MTEKIISEFEKFLLANNVKIADGSMQWIALKINIEKILQGEEPPNIFPGKKL